MLQLLKSRLSPFKHKAFRRFFIVQALSLVGQWSHDLARAWIVLELMGKAGALGSLMLAVAIPSLFLMPQGGVLVDRVDARRLMMLTKAILATVSIALAFVTEFSSIQMWHLVVFALIEGATISFDSPAFQTLAVRLVPREDFQQAVALNMTNFHTARMLGPIVAGVLMAFHGPSLVFLFDGITYLILVFVLSTLPLEQVQRKVDKTRSNYSALVEGMKYLFTTPSMRFYLLQLFITICFVFPLLIVVFRTYIKLKYNLSSDEFGYVFSFPAAGAMLGALIFAALKPKVPTNALKLGVPGIVAMLWLLPLMPNLVWAVGLMSFTGFFAFLCFASLTVSIHLNVQEEYRGRMGSLIGLSFISIGPLMSYPMGVFADYFGYEFTMILMASIFGLASAALAFFHWHTQKVDRGH